MTKLTALIFLSFNCLNAYALDGNVSDSPLKGELIFINNEKDSEKKIDDEIKKRESESPPIFKQLHKASKPIKEPKATKNTNLPDYYLSLNILKLSSTESQVIMPQDLIKERLKSLKPGQILEAKVEHSLLSFPDEKSPVVATVLGGFLNQSRLIGFSRLEENSKRIFIDFEIISPQNKMVSFNFKGSGLTEAKSQGFQGIYHSKEAKYFAGDFVSSFISAYFDSQVPRYLSPLGGTIEDNSLGSATKKAFSQSAMSSAERFREKLKKVPEFSELKGPFNLQVLVLSSPIEI